MFYRLVNNIIQSGSLDANGKTLARLQRFIDIVVIGLLFYVYQPGATWTANYINIPSMYIVIVITAILLPKAGIYRSSRHKNLKRMVQKLNSTWISIICFVILAVFLNKSSTSYSRIAMTLWAISSWLWLITMHVATRVYLRNIRRIGLNSRTILYWGNPQAALNFSEQLSRNPWLGYRIVAWFSPVEVSDNYQSYKLPQCGGGIEELKEWLNNNDANNIVFSSTDEENKNTLDPTLFNVFGNTCSRVLYAPDWYINTMRFENECIGEQNCIEIWGVKQTYDERLVKII